MTRLDENISDTKVILSEELLQLKQSFIYTFMIQVQNKRSKFWIQVMLRQVISIVTSGSVDPV